MHRKSIFVTRLLPPKSQAELISKCNKFQIDLHQWKEPRRIPYQTFIEQIKDKDAILIMLTEKITAEALENVISTMSVGCDHIDTNLLKERNITLYNTPDVLTDATADLAILLLLATMRRAIESMDLLRSGNVKEWSPTGMCGIGLQNKIIGIVGLGRIGRNIAERLIPFKIKNIIYHSRSSKSTYFDQVDFETLLKVSDVIIVSCELNETTKNLFGYKEFLTMKKNVVFINIARGAIVNQEDLCKCLDLGMFAGVGLDVTDPEPLSAEHPLLTKYGGKVVVLPHIGSATFETREAMASLAINQLIDDIK